MKKILIIQHKASTFGGIWTINSSLAREFQKRNYEVKLVAVRNKFDEEKIKDINTSVINDKAIWDVLTLKDCLKLLLKFRIREFKRAFKDNRDRLKDIKDLGLFIKEYDPNYIIVSQYQLLDGIPKEYYKKTFMHVHSNFNEAINHKATRKTFAKYNGDISFVWLSNQTKDEAINWGLKNSICIYNFVNFETNKLADVNKNKKIVTLTRLSKEKNIDLMIKIVEAVFKEKKHKDWVFEIYGDGSERKYLETLITNNKQIKIMGKVDNVEKVLLKSSINLNTSYNEGFCLSIIEGYACGVPSLSFDYNGPTHEVILENKTGYIAKDATDYVGKLSKLLDDSDLLKKMGINANNHSKKFHIDNSVKNWIKEFNKIDKGDNND